MTWTTIATFATGTFAGTILKEGWSFLREWWLQRHKTRIQALTDNAVYVTKAHFDTEFTAMKDVFKCLSNVRLIVSGIRPQHGIGPSNQSREDKIEDLFKRLQGLQEAYNSLIAQSEALSPFYPQPLYEALDECIKAVRLEIVQVQIAADDTFSLKWYTDGAENRERFMKAYNLASQIIRERISRLAVLPSI